MKTIKRYFLMPTLFTVCVFSMIGAFAHVAHAADAAITVNPNLGEKASLTCVYPDQREDNTSFLPADRGIVKFYLTGNSIPIYTSPSACGVVIDYTNIANGVYSYEVTISDIDLRESDRAIDKFIVTVVRPVMPPKFPTVQEATVVQ